MPAWLLRGAGAAVAGVRGEGDAWCADQPPPAMMISREIQSFLLHSTHRRAGDEAAKIGSSVGHLTTLPSARAMRVRGARVAAAADDDDNSREDDDLETVLVKSRQGRLHTAVPRLPVICALAKVAAAVADLEKRAVLRGIEGKRQPQQHRERHSEQRAMS